MTPVIGISVSTLMLPGTRGVRRFALPDYYVRCVQDAGGLPVLFPNVSADAAAGYLARVDGLLLSGGVDVDPSLFEQEPHPKLGEVDTDRDHFEIALARGARDAGMPILAICRGSQVLNVAFGGTLMQDVPSLVEGALMHEQKALRHDAPCHSLTIEPGTHLHEIAGSTSRRVNSFHHQAVDRLADGFRVTARSSDGVIEGIEDPAHPFCVGVQWHPERMPEHDLTKHLFGALVEAAAQVARAGSKP